MCRKGPLLLNSGKQIMTTEAVNERWSRPKVEEVVDLWELTESEQRDLERLGNQLRDVQHFKNAPSEVIRFLRARPGDLQAAESMFRSMVEWRIENKVDTILERYRPPQEILDHYPGAILQGHDKAGDPIFIERLGVTDGVGILERYGRNEMIQHAIWLRELITTGDWIQHYQKRRGRTVRQIVIMEDLYGLSIAHMNRQLLSVYGEIMRLDQDNYPETAKKLIVLRAPNIFRIIWTIAKHFFDPGVVKKMTFTGHANYKQVLREHLDLEILPDCVVPEGKGKAAEGLPGNFQGGPLPIEKVCPGKAGETVVVIAKSIGTGVF